MSNYRQRDPLDLAQIWLDLARPGLPFNFSSEICAMSRHPAP